MYTEFYHLQTYAFGPTVSSSGLFRWAGFREAEARLRYVLARRALTYVVGPVGVGKTTLLRALREGLGADTHRFCYLATPASSTRAVLRSLSQGFGLPEVNAFAHVAPQLSEHLWSLHQGGITPVVCVDDAHAASLELLEALRALTNFDMDSQPVLALVLAGQRALASHLQMPAYRALAQRMVQPYQLPPMHMDETASYIHHHVQRAGAADPLFEPDAIALIYHATQGVARQINRLCEMALLHGAALEQRPITRALIQGVLDDIGTL